VACVPDEKIGTFFKLNLLQVVKIMVINLKSDKFKSLSLVAENSDFRPCVRGCSSHIAYYRFSLSRYTINFYSVAIYRSYLGVPSGSCDCDAGKQNQLCWHLASAVLHHSSLVRSGVRSALAC
jgi:hypothetical protein